MGIGFKHGSGGGSLNFDVIAYATEALLLAAAPMENTIGIVSDVPVSGWAFGASAPENPNEGMVWIRTGITSAVAFNALKTNALWVCPIDAKQYIGGAWVNVTAKSYQNGTWVSWLLWLVQAGNAQQAVTPTPVYAADNLYKASATITQGNGTLDVAVAPDTNGVDGSCILFFPLNDLSPFSALSLTGYYSGFAIDPTEVKLGIWSAATGARVTDNLIASSGKLTGKESTVTIDLSEVAPGKYYAGVAITSSLAGMVHIKEIFADQKEV